MLSHQHCGSLSLILLGFLYFTALWEMKSIMGSRDNGWHTFDICTHLEASLFLPVASSKTNRTFCPLTSRASCTSVHSCSKHQQARKSASRPCSALTLPGRQVLTEAGNIAADISPFLFYKAGSPSPRGVPGVWVGPHQW